MELVFERNRKSVKRANWFLMFCQIGIKFLRVRNGSVKEDLVEAVKLLLLVLNFFKTAASGLPIGVPMPLYGKKPV